MINRLNVSFLLSLLLTSSLLGCGFQLRGAVELPPSMQMIFVQGGSLALNRELKGLLASSATVVEQAADAQAILQVMGEKNTRRTLSVDSRGKVQEMELHYAVRFQVRKPDGEVLLAEETISLQRDYLNDESDVLGKSNEAVVLQTEMQRDAAQRIVRRIQAIH